MTPQAVIDSTNFNDLFDDLNFTSTLNSLLDSDLGVQDTLNKLKTQKVLPKENLNSLLEENKVITDKTVFVTKKPQKKSKTLSRSIAVILGLTSYAGYFNFNNTELVSIPVPTPAEQKKTNQIPFKFTKPIVENTRTTTHIGPKDITSIETTDNTPELVQPTVQETQEDQQPKIFLDTRDPQILIDEARALLISGPENYEQAITNLRSVILSQPLKSDYAKTAHEMLGYAYEKSKKWDKAMGEYSKYLALYPEDNEDRTRVKQRLMALEIFKTPEGFDINKSAIKQKPREGDKQELSGSISEYLYSDSNSDELKFLQWNNKQINSITGINLLYQWQHNQYSLTSKIRLTEVRDLTGKKGNRNNLGLAYVDFDDSWKEYNIRAGRQSPEAGAISKFDGLSTTISLNDKIKIKAAAGSPYVGPGNNTNRKFIGTEISYERGPSLTLGGYLNRGTADGFLERMAIGTEVWYHKGANTGILRTEYDTLYHSWNSITFQGSTGVKGYRLFGVYEKRRSPMPFGDVGLGIGLLSPDKQVYNSVGSLVSESGLSSSEIYHYISDTTPTASALVLGISKPLNEDWTATFNWQKTNLSTTPGFDLTPNFDSVPVQVGQNNNYSYNLHLRAENFKIAGNTFEIVMNQTTGQIQARYITLADSFKFNGKKDIFFGILRADEYAQSYGTNKSLSLILREIHSLSDQTSIETQYGISIGKNIYLNQSLPNTNQNFYIGIRHDF